ncbi:MAG: MucR family transcriptional regulator [Novosphingobium sp.]|nr:MucR family transcriptional regulator [Novosphingobium sp.]
MADDTGESNTLELATELTIAWLSNPNTRVSADEVPSVLEKMHGAVASLTSAGSAQDEAPAQAEFTPAVSARKSLASKDHIISMIDGKPYKSLKRHLSRHGLTPEQYRQRYGLRADYPMVSENYAQMRRDLAKKIGLGRKPGEKVQPKASRKGRGKQAAATGGDAQA